MHSHGIAPNSNTGNLEAANAAQRSTSMQQTLAVRKKLSSQTAQLDDDASFESLVLLGSAHSGEQRKHDLPDENKVAQGEGIKEQGGPDADEHRSYWA
jgi:hypothetical protein